MRSDLQVKTDPRHFQQGLAGEPRWDGGSEVDAKVQAQAVPSAEQIPAEEALRQSEERFRLLVDEAKDYAILMLDTDGRVNHWNAGAERLKGYHAEEILGEHFSRFFIEEDREQGKPDWELKEAAANGRLEEEGWRVRKDGSRFWADVIVTALHDRSGNLVGFSKLVRDMTERRKAMEELRQSQEQFHAYFELAGIGAAVIDVDSGRLIRVNDRYCEITGYSREELLATTVRQLTHPEDQMTDWDSYSRMVRGETREYGAEKRYVRKDGKIIWVQISATAVRNPQGRPLWSLGFVQDITQRKLDEEALRRSEEQLSAILQNTNTGIYLLSPEGRIIHINRRWEELLHIKNKDVRGRSIFEFLPYKIASDCVADHQRVVATRAPITVENVAILPDGPHNYTVTKTPLFDAATGNIWGIVGVSTDITRQKSMENMLREAVEKLGRVNEQLEERVKERTASLEDSVKSLEGVLYHVAHDLRAPLRAMHSFTQLLMESCTSEQGSECEEFSNIILRASHKMDLLIHDLLEYGRLGCQNVHLASVDLKTLADRVIAGLRNEVKISKALIQVDGPLPKVWADFRILEQVMTNLVSNGLKFVSPGVSPFIRIWAGARGGKVRLYFQDNGIGIAPEYHERIFNVFERLHGEKEAYPGTGIGLAIVKKGMERLQGAVGVESRPGTGSRFWLELDAARPRDSK